jgi:sugar phosphate isomerase/epimerase
VTLQQSVAKSPRFSISQITTLPATFEDDLRVYHEAGAEGIGIWEIKLEEGREEEQLAALRESGLESTSAVPAVPSIAPIPIPGPEKIGDRIEAYCGGLRRLARFEPTAVVLLTGAGERGAIVDGLRAVAVEARSLGLRIALEPYGRHGGEEWTIVNTLPEAVELIEEAGVADAVGIQFDVWHLWDSEGLEEHIAAEIDRIVGVHVNDVREPTRSFADRVLPGDGVADVPRIVAALDRAGWNGFYDLEIFSDNGAFGNAFPDSLWDVPPDELVRRGLETLASCWKQAQTA